MKYLGIIIVLLGALTLIVPALANLETNVTLAIGMVLLVAGAIAHVFLYKKGMDKE